MSSHFSYPGTCRSTPGSCLSAVLSPPVSVSWRGSCPALPSSSLSICLPWPNRWAYSNGLSCPRTFPAFWGFSIFWSSPALSILTSYYIGRDERRNVLVLVTIRVHFALTTIYYNCPQLSFYLLLGGFFHLLPGLLVERFHLPQECLFLTRFLYFLFLHGPP